MGSVGTFVPPGETGIDAIMLRVADLRMVPLEHLPADGDALDLVNEVMSAAQEPAGVDVAKFNSAI